jgi:hypothetical protein
MNNLLNSKEMALFTKQGFLRFDEMIDTDLCKEFFSYMENPESKQYQPQGQLLWDVWDEKSPIGKIIHHPDMIKIIHSLVGKKPRYDHHFPHKTHPGKGLQHLHQDAEYDMREHQFDIQISLYPQDTSLEMGGTRFLPSSHFRKVNEATIGRYQHIRGMQQMVCKAGTVLVWHTGLWHAAQPNISENKTRYMFKLRLNPMEKQQRLFDTFDLNDVEVSQILNQTYLWHGQSHRRELFNRIKFWRYISDQPDYDLDMWMTRNENSTHYYKRSQVT